MTDWLLFVGVGFLAQLIDGALGMAYGVSSTTVLLSLGVSPAAASASVHAAEIFTTAVSGAAHFRLGNVDMTAFRRLVIPGVLGGGVGAYLLTAIDGDVIKPYISLYLLLIGVFILIRVWRPIVQATVGREIIPLGLVGGFFDAIGGGGWGPIVTSTLVARGTNPRYTVGSVNAAEFFVTLSESIVFILTIGLVHWQIIAGLIVGGVIAAPMAAYVTKRIPTRWLMMLVAVLIMGLSARTILLALL